MQEDCQHVIYLIENFVFVHLFICSNFIPTYKPIISRYKFTYKFLPLFPLQTYLQVYLLMTCLASSFVFGKGEQITIFFPLAPFCFWNGVFFSPSNLFILWNEYVKNYTCIFSSTSLFFRMGHWVDKLIFCLFFFW